ncbi:hypothetical protein C8R48DRAFT_760350 [Suillus tomentosus]|nr:hypothetical protein C8R48DRAFT_760350 [Suillus tomentosus]
MTGKAKAALEEQTIRTLSKKHKNNSSGDSGNMNLKKAKKTPLPGNTPTNGAGSMDEDEPVDKNRPVTAPLSPCPELISSRLLKWMTTVLIISSANGKEKVMYSDHQHSRMMDEAYNEDRFVDEAELLDERIQAVKLVLVKVCKLA